jgi:hypothetical protein
MLVGCGWGWKARHALQPSSSDASRGARRRRRRLPVRARGRLTRCCRRQSTLPVKREGLWRAKRGHHKRPRACRCRGRAPAARGAAWQAPVALAGARTLRQQLRARLQPCGPCKRGRQGPARPAGMEPARTPAHLGLAPELQHLRAGLCLCAICGVGLHTDPWLGLSGARAARPPWRSAGVGGQGWRLGGCAPAAIWTRRGGQAAVNGRACGVQGLALARLARGRARMSEAGGPCRGEI